MIEVPAYPGDGWLPVVCRLCTRSFSVLVTDTTDEPVVLCQACALFVEVLGQPANPMPAPRLMSSSSKELQQPAPPEPTPAPLSTVWGHWWTRWRESQQEEPAPDTLSSEPGAEASC